MRTIAILAVAMLIAAITAFSMPRTSVAAATQSASSSRQSQCEAQKRSCLEAGSVVGQFGTRYVPPDVAQRCWDAYRSCMGG
jgi:hypothetical protein